MLLIKQGGTMVDSVDTPWDSELNDWAITQGVRAETVENESERFGVTLSDRLASIVVRYGDGFFNAVLIQHLVKEGFASVSPTQEKLARIRESQPASGESAVDCEQMIQAIIQAIARELVDKLGYSREDAQRVLTAAIAYYLDERFNITNSKLLGFG